jgi:hypothetical protein
VNEEIVPLGNGIVGAYCRPKFDLAGGHVVFKNTFDPVQDLSAVLTEADELKDTGGFNIVSRIRLPRANAPLVTENYNRGIWKCDLGFVPDTSNPVRCVFDRARHRCDETSAVSNRIGGFNTANRFQNTVNKKLACCLNQFESNAAAAATQAAGQLVKFDCIENVRDNYSVNGAVNFNQLWRSHDEALDGGQMNAFILAGAGGQPVSGFYTLKGQRCGEYSEFSTNSIFPGKLNPAIVAGQSNLNAAGSGDFVPRPEIPRPTGSAFNELTSAQPRTAPSTNAERRRCPILVRAAAMMRCPDNPGNGAPMKTYEERDAAGNIIVRRCSIASSVQVKIRIEQVFEISGEPILAPIDTVVDGKNASAIAVDRIIRNKYGNRCPPGTTRQGDACVY